MSYIDLLREKAEQTGSIVCMGLDPVIEKIPIEEKDDGEKIIKFYTDILDAIKAEGIALGAVKPNYAFYAQYGFPGLRALKEIISLYKKAGHIVILDAKRGDIGKTSDAYAKEVFGFWGADAVTVAPYMGNDSFGPFTKYCEKSKGVYLIVRTSNPGAVDLQNIKTSEGNPFYMETSKLLLKYYKPGISAVIGATYPSELKEISSFFVSKGKQVPFLIPGVGGQGGSAKEIIHVLKETKNPLWLHRISSSSGISFAWEKEGNPEDFAMAAVREIKKLNEEIGYKP